MKKINVYLMSIMLFFPLQFCSSSVYANSILNNANSSNNQHQETTQVNINIASAEELAKNLNGIGLNKAKKIVEYRDKFGPFVAIEQLKEVSGIGQSTLDKNVSKIIL